MKAVTLDKFGGVEQMHWTDIPTPQPANNEVQIEIAYASVNPVDWKISEGYLQNVFDYEFPIIPGWDAAGIISAAGKNVKKFKVGDEVFSYCRKPIVQWGTYAEYICFDAENIALKPENISFAQAAAVPLAGLTAWQGLFDLAKLKKGQTVLIHAGAGGVGSFAIEFAKITGAKIYTTASSKHHDYVRQLGADVIIDYNNEDFVDRIRRSEPDGLDCVLDCVGRDTLSKSYEIVKPGGHLVSIVNKIDENKARQKNIKGSFMLVRPEGKQLSQIANLINEGRVNAPHIEEFSLKDFARALQLSQQGHTQGKIVLKVK